MEKGWRTVRYLLKTFGLNLILFGCSWIVNMMMMILMNVCTNLSRAIAVNVKVDMYTEIHYKMMI